MCIVNKAWFYSWMAFTKAQFGLVVVSITHWCAPVTIKVSGDESIGGQLKKSSHGDLDCDFPDRALLISNHQVSSYCWPR